MMLEEIYGLADFDQLRVVVEQYGSKWYLMSHLQDELLTPMRDGNEISLLGCKINPSVLVHDNADPENFVKAWNLTANLIDTQKLLLVYYLFMAFKMSRTNARSRIIKHLGIDPIEENKSLEDSLTEKYRNNLEQIGWYRIRYFDERCGFTHVGEPLFTNFLRLCYWLYKSNRLISNKNDSRSVCKEVEKITDILYDVLVEEIDNLDQDNVLGQENSNKIIVQFRNLNTIIKNYLSELFITELLLEEGKNVKEYNFQSAGISHKFLMIDNGLKLKIITILDMLKGTVHTEDSLEYVVWNSLLKDNIRSLINDCLKLKPDVIVIVFSHTIVGYSILDRLTPLLASNQYTLSRSMNELIKLRSSGKISNEMPVIIFADGISIIEDESMHNTFSTFIRLPTMMVTEEKDLLVDVEKIRQLKQSLTTCS